MCSMSDECTLIRKKLLEIHDYDCGTFETESVLELVGGLLNLVTSETDGNQNGPTHELEKKISDALRYSQLHEISRVFYCKCSGGDAAMEVLELLSSYEWEAKIVIVLASFVLEFAQFIHVTKLYKNKGIGEIFAVLKPIRDDGVDNIKLKSKTIIERSIKLTKLIAKFGKLSSKYISNDAKPMALALDQIPIAVYFMTKSVVACASLLAEIHAHSEISSSTETREISSLEKKINETRATLKEKHQSCLDYIEHKKTMKYVEKLKLRFNQRTVYKDNQKILQLIIKKKDGLLFPLAYGLNNEQVGLEDLKEKTVLLFISNLDISNDEISMLAQFYKKSRENSELQQFEILWLPIVENEEDGILRQKFVGLRSKMPWHSLQDLIPNKSAVVKFMMEEWQWNYSEKNPILVALDPQGKMVNRNAFQMVWAWGNKAYPFTKRCEVDKWNHKKWSLQLLVENIDQNISKWIEEDKIICLYGGESKDDTKWIEEFIEKAKEFAKLASPIELKTMYIGKDTSQELTEMLHGLNEHRLNTESANDFWNRIKGIVKSESCNRGKIATAKRAILDEMQHVYRLHRSGKSWALISQGAGSEPGKIAKGSGNEILRGLREFELWSSEVSKKGFVVALNRHLSGGRLMPESDICKLCHRAM